MNVISPPIRSESTLDLELLEGASFVLRRCKSCTLVYQSQVGDDFILGQLYTKSDGQGRALERGQIDLLKRDFWSQLVYAREVISILYGLGKLPAEIRVLDFGMGWSRWCRMVQGFGCQVYGAELSEDRIEFAQSQGISIVHWDEIPKHEFDFINTEQVFEHLVDPLPTLKHLVQGLAP